MTDSQSLLAAYVQTGSDVAFRDLVTRYVDLVYSTALRLVNGDAHRAKDVTQTVFVDLTRAARTLPGDVLLGGWLHRHTCFVAANVMRGERRRQNRERQALEMNALQPSPEPDFQRLAPLLDEAINELSEADRTAIVLRFFEQHDFRSIGQALASNEDAARMRVNRALEKLQDLLKRRGLTSSAAALSVVLSANAVQAAPVGLALAVATAATATGATLVTAATVTTTKAIAMTTATKILLGTTLTIAIGAGLYQARQNARLRGEVQSLQQQGAQQEREFNQERADLAVHLTALQTENDRAETNAAELAKLRGEVARLRAQTATAVAPAPANLNLPDANTNASRVAVELPKDSWNDAGFASVESALQTRGWSVLNGNRERFKESVFITPEAKEIMEKLLEDMINAAPAAERKKFSQMILDNNLGFEEAMLMPMMAENQAKGYAGYQILSQQTVSPGEMVLQVATQMTAAPTKTETLRFRRIDNAWKLVVDEQFMNAHR